MQKTADRWEVIPNTPGAAESTLELGGKRYPWGRQGAFHLKDEGVARALEQKYDGQVLTMKVDVPDERDRGHRYLFTVPELPWKVRDGEEEESQGLQGRAEEDRQEAGRLDGTGGRDPGLQDQRSQPRGEAQEPGVEESQGQG